MSNSRIDYSHIDESDLNLDLDDDEDDNFGKKTKIDDNNNNENKKLESEDDEDALLFKLPDPIPLSEKLKNQNENNLEESINFLDSHEKRAEITLDNLFESDEKDDEENEDYFIRTQPIFSSTQVCVPKKIEYEQTQDRKSQEKIDNSNIKNDIVINLIPSSNKQKNNLNSSIIITTQSVSELISKRNINEQSSKLETSVLQEYDNLRDSSIWEYAQHDLNRKFCDLGLDCDLLKKLTIDYYFKKFFDYSLLRIAETGLRKLPLLCLYIKEITRNDRNSNATVVLTDGIDQMKGTISKQISTNHWEKLSIGSVLVLQNVCILRVNFSRNGYHLNINKPNLLRLYYKLNDQINKIDFCDFRSDNLQDFIENFEKTYVFIDTSLIKMNNNCINKSGLNMSSNTSTNSSKLCNNQKTRPVPYQVPQQFANNNNLINNNKNQNRTSNSNNQAENRSFKFNNNNKNNNNQNKEKLTNSNSDSIVIQSSQKEISEDVFSQLIFGIEDEFLKDDS